MQRRTFNRSIFVMGAGLPLRRFATKDTVIGHGDFRYRVDASWCKAEAARHPVKDCHEMAMDRKGLIYMSTNDTRNNILVFNKDGQVVNAWGTEYPGAHGLTLHDENGTEVLYITDYERHEVVKTTLDGRVLRVFEWPSDTGLYPDKTAFKPTETAILPSGDVLVADGYGLDYILRYSPEGQLKSSFGGRGESPASLENAHGVAIDLRKSGHTEILVSSRVQNTLKRYDLQGAFLGAVPLPGAFICRPVVHQKEVYFAVLISKLPWDSRSGFLCVLDEQNQVVAALGGNLPQMHKGEMDPFYQTVQVFRHPHDVLADADGTLFVAQWNSDRVYPIRLTRVP
ncbi:MAG: 6-bladed beta-propeller [Lewinellaceae bacterium]|nr:6-bladed beta-propeller [Lewinellaceae bacterium]